MLHYYTRNAKTGKLEYIGGASKLSETQKTQALKYNSAVLLALAAIPTAGLSLLPIAGYFIAKKLKK